MQEGVLKRDVLMNIGNCDSMQRAREILRKLDLPTFSIEYVESHSNQVWMTRDYVVHYHVIGPVGRLEHEARVASRLPPEVLYPEVVAVGRDGNHDWLVTKRVPGTILSAVWPSLDDKERCSAITEVAAALRAIHCSPAMDLIPPCLQRGVRVMSRRRLAHKLQAFDISSSFHTLLEAEDPPYVMVHGDFTFNQALWHDGHITAIYDLEMSHAETPDWDLGTFLEFCHDPVRMVPEYLEATTKREDYQKAPALLQKVYPELLACSQIKDRLALYLLIFRFEELITNAGMREQIIDEAFDHASELADLLASVSD